MPSSPTANWMKQAGSHRAAQLRERRSAAGEEEAVTMERLAASIAAMLGV